MTYAELLARQPTPAQYGDRDAAQQFVALVTDALLQRRVWTHAQRAYLHRLYVKWWARADGQDTKWMLHKPRRGRPQKIATAPRFERDATVLDPLSARLIKKYGGNTGAQ